jgi:hypothetical protein
MDTRRLGRVLGVLVVAGMLAVVVPPSAVSAASTGTVSGTVTGPGEAPLAGVEVTVFNELSAGFDVTDGAGHYSVGGLAPGGWQVQFWPPDGSGLVPHTSAPFGLVAGQTVVIDVELEEAGSLSGTVTAVGDGPVEGVEVFVNSFDVEASAFTAADGTYELTALAPGEYTVQFLPPFESGLVPFLYPDPVVIASGEHEVIDVALEPGATISGTIEVPDGVDPNEDVMALALASQWAAFSSIDPDGSWEISGLPSGEYLVGFDTFVGSGVVPEFYDDSPMPLGADLVEVDPGEDVTGIDATLDFCEPSFTDVDTFDAFCIPSEWLETSGIAGGFPDGTFRPTRTVSRGAMASFLWRRAGAPAGPFDPPGYSDVPPDHVFATPIAWATEEGVITGFPDGTFRPTAPVSRQAAAAMFWRDAGEPPFPLPPEVCLFVDVCGDHPFAEPIAFMVFGGIADGFDDDTFRPTLAVARQGMAKFFYRDQIRADMEVLFPVPPAPFRAADEPRCGSLQLLPALAGGSCGVAVTADRR